MKKGKGKKFSFSLFTMLMMLSLAPLVLSVTIISITSLYITKSNLEKDAKEKLFIVANNLASYCRENEINAINVGNYYEYLDSLKEQQIEMAIIIEGAPCATSIKNENDYRIREIEFEKDIIENADEIKYGYYDEDVEIDGKVYCAYYMPIEMNGEIIGMTFAGELRDHVTGAVKSIVVSFVLVAVCLLLLSAVVVIVLSTGLLRSFQAVGKSVNALAEGDLKSEIKQQSFVREMDILLRETEIMQKNLSDTIGKVKYISQRLAENILNVTKLSESSSGKAEQITSSMEELATSTVEMNENVQDIYMQMMEMGNEINDISENVERLHESSGNILKTNDEATVNMDIIMESSKKSVDAVNDISMQIRQTNDSIAEIDKAVGLILGISQQTNLLSLNASIEAARAGELGKGFAVVAQEIRNLSEQSAEGAEMIKELAQTINEQSRKSVSLADRVHGLILEELEGVSKTKSKYAELSMDISRSVDDIRSIAEKTGYLSDYKEKVVKNVQLLSGISKENSLNNEGVNQNIGEIMTQIQNVNENCEKMNVIAGELEDTAAFFDI